MIHKEQFTRLLEAYKKGIISPAEEEELFGLINRPEYRSLLENAVEDSLHADALQGPVLTTAETALMLQTIRQRNGAVTTPVIVQRICRPWFRYAVAAAVLLLVGMGYYLSVREKGPVEASQPAAAYKDVPPGKNGAVLTLADGRSVTLDSIADGLIAHQGGTRVMMENGRLTYIAQDDLPGAVMYNTMRTPNGRQFYLQLPDGTGVWLNAGSSITYPVIFQGPERTVSITGEVYFEVAPRLLMPHAYTAGKTPFIVKIQSASGKSKGEVEVLGTHFNINAYDDESSEKITLLEGSIKVSVPAVGRSRVLAPGQQAEIPLRRGGAPDGDIVVTEGADLERAVAWKNGQFYFNGDNIQTIMRQVEKWYDVRVKFESEIDHSFVARISREVNVSSLLHILELTDLVHFDIRDDTIIVRK